MLAGNLAPAQDRVRAFLLDHGRSALSRAETLPPDLWLELALFLEGRPGPALYNSRLMSEPLRIVTLGGCGGFGLNATLFVYGGDAVLVDFGIGFPRGAPTTESVNWFPTPDLSSIEFPDCGG